MLPSPLRFPAYITAKSPLNLAGTEPTPPDPSDNPTIPPSRTPAADAIRSASRRASLTSDVSGQACDCASVEVRSDLNFNACVLPNPANNHGLNIAFIRFTSGTTSARKGVVLCHETIRDRVFAANKALQIRSEDIVMWCLPMSHHFLITIVLYLTHGATIELFSWLAAVRPPRG